MAGKREFFASLAPTSVESTPMPALPTSAIDAPLGEVFASMLESVGGTLGQGNRLADVDRRVAGLLDEGRQVLSLVPGVQGNRDPAAVTDPHQLGDLDYTVAPARLAVAENGCVWISGDDLVMRNAVFICEHLIAVVDEDNLVGTLSDAIERVGALGGRWGVFVSGPSKTADIEQALVMGAHGARTMTVHVLPRAAAEHPE
jgi:L-lactate dehydrogenase complex protein LldG